MVNDHSDSEKGNPLPPHRLLLLINSKTERDRERETQRDRETDRDRETQRE